jgi:photosystem II stability/assembly factor-like uncharacterized protein
MVGVSVAVLMAGLPARAASAGVPDLYGVAATSADHAVAVGGSGTIVSTTNGGQTWAPRLSGTEDDLKSVDFPDATHGWAVGNNGVVLSTANGGATWTSLSSGITNDLMSVAFASPSHGWAVGNGGIILATADGGVNWTPQSSGTADDLTSVTFANQEEGWAVGQDPDTFASVILHTTNGGGSWAVQATASADCLYGITCTDVTHCWVVGYNNDTVTGDIFCTTNGGANWTAQGPHGIYAPFAVTFANANNGWAVGGDSQNVWVGDAPAPHNTILATANGGATWTAQSSGLVFGNELTYVAFASATDGWAVGYYSGYGDGDADSGIGLIVATTGGGAHWTLQKGTLPTSITIKTSAATTYIGKTPILSGAVTPNAMIGVNIVVYVQKPGKSYWTYSSNRTVYALGIGAAWQYKYYFKPGMTKGLYRFKAVAPAPGFASSDGFATSESATIVIRVR